MMHKWFADLMLPVAISTQWCPIYDADIQSLIGFYVLCSYVLGTNDSGMSGYVTHGHDVQLGICPVQFLLYLRMRCAMDSNRLSDIAEIISDWWIHVEQCTGDKNANSARIVLQAILRFQGVVID